MPRRRSPKRRKLTGPIHGRIAELRKARELTQQDLAAKIGVDETAISHWENGVARPEPLKLPGLASTLGVTVDELIEGDADYEALREAFAS